MKPGLNKAEKLLLLSICFTLAILAARLLHTHNKTYLFYPWNLFLAVVPVYFSRKLSQCNTVDWKSIALMAGWLLFFPNAPYLVTDILHFYQRPGVPLWYDLFIVFSAAWNGLAAGFISLMQVDKFIASHTGKKMHAVLISGFLFAASNGIYLGRFLRYNSWDIVVKPISLTVLAFKYTFHPTEHLKAWAFCALCTVFLTLIYYTIKNLPALLNTVQAEKNITAAL